MIASSEINRVQYSDLISFLREFNCNVLQIKLLHFLAWHRLTKLSFDALADALGIKTITLRQEIKLLIYRGILLEQNQNGVITYSLVNTYPVQDYFDRLAMLDWSETFSLIQH
jgi:predicted DNA-binding transcriptional regulator